MTDLVVVPAERHVERLHVEGVRAETRSALAERLADALLPGVTFAKRELMRTALAIALRGELPLPPPAAPAPSPPPRQLDLFASPRGAAPASIAPEPPAIAAMKRQGGPSWAHLVTALDEGIATLRAALVSGEDLAAVASGTGPAASRAALLQFAIAALDAHLDRGRLKDPRSLGALLAAAIVAADVDVVIRAVGAERLRARWILDWDAADLAWWRALDEVLGRRRGHARVVLPIVEQALDPTRERDALEVVGDWIARGLDAAPEFEPIAHPQGRAPASEGRPAVTVWSPRDPAAQATAVAQAVAEALEVGVAVERIAVAVPRIDEGTKLLVRALEERDLVATDPRGDVAAHAGVIHAALLALECATLERASVAQLLRSGYLDEDELARRAVARGGDVGNPDGRREVTLLAHALVSQPTRAGSDAVERFVRTAVAGRAGDVLARHVASILTAPLAAKTRGAHSRAARVLFAELGLGVRAGRGGRRAFAGDGDPSLGRVHGAERVALARDVRAWEVLEQTLDAIDAHAARTGALDDEVDAITFRLELADALERARPTRTGGRAFAVRVARLDDLVGDALDLLLVLDANEGVLPSDRARDSLVSEALASRLGATGQGRGARLAPLLRPQRLEHAIELARLTTAMTDAARVVISVPTDDGAGDARSPSVFVEDLLRLEVAAAAPCPPAPRPARVAEDVSVVRRARREAAREGLFLDPARATRDVTGDLRGSVDAALGAVLEAETGGADRPLAVTGLERFLRCPFMGHAHVILAAREGDERDELPDAREEGTVVHEALAAAFVACALLWPRRPRPADEILARGLEAADRVLAAWQGHATLRTVVRLRIRDAVRALLTMAIEDEAWDFILAEEGFGGRRDGWRPFELSDGETLLRLRGAIDRVDRAHDGRSLRVVDYKRSKHTVRNALGEWSIQVPLYACVARRELGAPATGLYLATQARDVAAAAKLAPKIAAHVHELVTPVADAPRSPIEARALEIVRRVRGGRLVPVPLEETACRTCAVSGGCRKPRFAMALAEETFDDA